MDGNLLIHLSLISNCIALLSIIYSSIIKNNNIRSLGICCFLFACGVITLSFLTLIRGYIVSDMSLINVAMNSSHLMPIHYRIAAVWGNHEGSMLLLVTYFSIASVIFYKLSYKSSFAQYSVIIQLSVNITLLLFVIKTSNPFIKVFPIPNIGLGLNPVLQDSALVLHPPILYLGHAGCFIIFSIGMSFSRYKKIEIIHIRPWILFSLSCLTLGIGMGSWWAYKEIGWGGYWFWDPVENISLLPWLVLCGLLHSINRGKTLYNMSLFLSIFGFIVVLLGISIVRAGLLKSVHSFAQDNERGIILFSIFLAYSAYGCWELSNGIRSVKVVRDRITQLICMSNYMFLGCIIIIFIGIFYPLLSEFFQGIAISIDAHFFNITFNSLILISLYLCIISTVNRIKKPYLLIPIAIGIFSLIVIGVNIDYLDVLAILGIVSGSYTIIKPIVSYIQRRELNFYIIASHGGFGLGILAISVSSLFSVDHQQLMSIGETTTFENFEITLSDIEHNLKENYITKTAVINLKSDYSKFSLYPELRIFPIEKQMTSEPAIARHILYDLHINISQVTDDGYLFTFYYRPLINWLWIAVLIISTTVMLRAIQDFIKLYKFSRSRAQVLQ
jgi:cytochrome c-type biogenesis protein CcmF